MSNAKSTYTFITLRASPELVKGRVEEFLVQCSRLRSNSKRRFALRVSEAHREVPSVIPA
jgi:hypothetical protein